MTPEERLEEAFGRFLLNPRTRDVFERAKKVTDGVLNVVCGPTERGGVFEYLRPSPPTITITPEFFPPDVDLIGIILVETLNASRYREIAALELETSAGNVSRVDYALRIESFEYDNIVTAASIFEWGNPIPATFPAYIEKLIENGNIPGGLPNHTRHYAEFWDRYRSAVWRLKHPQEDPNKGTEELYASLPEDLQARLWEAIGEPKENPLPPGWYGGFRLPAS